MGRITSEEAAHRLGVKRETLYAYVSRGVLTSSRSGDGRTSTFDAAEVERLARRGRPRRTTHGPVIDVTVHSSLTRLDRGHLTYRGADVVTLSGTATFEQVAGLLWNGDLPPHEPWPAPCAPPLPPGGTAVDRLRAAAALAAIGAPTDLRRASPAAMQGAARLVVAAMVGALGPAPARPVPRLTLGGDAPRTVRDTVAARTTVRLVPRRPGPETVAAVNAALVLLADHELAVSTLAARTAASTRADGFGVIGGGFGPLAGPLHGAASRSARRLLEEAERIGAVAAVRAAERDGRVPGFGHVVYTGGDPRALALLARVRALPGARHHAAVADDVVRVVGDTVGLAPNVDLALAALGLATGMPVDAGEAIFAVARTAGWVAHAIEELDERPLRYRARAVPR